MMRVTVRGALVASALLLTTQALAQGQAGATLSLPNAPDRTYVHEPGRHEFSGVMCARPLQTEDAAKYGVSVAELEALREVAKAALAEFELKAYVSDTDEYLFHIPAGRENAVARALMAGGGFQYVEPDWIVYPIGCPNDPLFGSQWQHNANRMNSCNGWDIHTGDPTTVVAICDTGVRTTHNDLQLHRQEGYNAVDNKWESQGGAVNDINGHGTATTGCAAANGNNGTGVAGVGWDLGHRMMRVSNSSGGSAYMSDLTQAARLASDQGDRVASVSYSGCTDNSVQTCGNYVRGNDALLVWAAGNAGQYLSGNRDDSVIVVGATTSTDSKASWSNYGPFVDLMAPGSSVYTTSNSHNNAYGGASGTSFSCPLAAGLCALIFSTDPTLTPTEAEDILRAGCDDLGSSGVDNTYGYGRIDVFNSLSLVDTCGVTDYCPSVPNSTGLEAAITYGGSVSVAANDLVLTAYNCPAQKFGLFFFGTQSEAVWSGDGILCVGGQMWRLPVIKTDSIGFADWNLDLNNLPGSASISPGDINYWSFWFRDTTSGGWNFTSALEIEWCP